MFAKLLNDAFLLEKSFCSRGLEYRLKLFVCAVVQAVMCKIFLQLLLKSQLRTPAYVMPNHLLTSLTVMGLPGRSPVF